MKKCSEHGESSLQALRLEAGIPLMKSSRQLRKPGKVVLFNNYRQILDCLENMCGFCLV